MLSMSTSRIFPGFDHVFEFAESGGSRAFRGDIELSGDEALAITRHEQHPAGPVIVRWKMGAKVPSDIIHTTLAIPIVVHARVAELFKQHHFSGWDSYPIKLYGKAGEEIAGYYGLSIKGRCGAIDNGMSRQVPRQYPAGEFLVWKGLYFDPESWDGSDLFMPSHGGWIFVIEEVMHAMRKARVKNVIFQPLDEIIRTML
jgi:hypothetical protein